MLIHYAGDAIVFNRGPESLRDYLTQRRRIVAGHLHLRRTQGYSVASHRYDVILLEPRRQAPQQPPPAAAPRPAAAEALPEAVRPAPSRARALRARGRPDGDPGAGARDLGLLRARPEPLHLACGAHHQEAAVSVPAPLDRVVVTGGTGFIGQHVARAPMTQTFLTL